MHINLYHTSKLVYVSVSHSIYNFLNSSKPQKNVINTKSVYNGILSNVSLYVLKLICSLELILMCACCTGGTVDTEAEAPLQNICLYPSYL